MQTILGATGPIGKELAKELHRNYTTDIRIVSRNPVRINDTDNVFAADLLEAEQTNEAVKGSDIAYLTVGLPMDTELWEVQFPVIMRNVIDACKEQKVKLVFFDNTYMFPQNEDTLTEDTPFKPVGRKGTVRAKITNMLLDEMERGEIEAMICRAPEFYGPGETKSITNFLIFESIRKGERPKIMLRDDVLKTLIWTPDASQAMALLGNTPDAYGKSWHLPCDDNRLTYKEFMAEVSRVYKQDFQYDILSREFIEQQSTSNKVFEELLELLPRYEHDNVFDSSRFKGRFPDFRVTTYREGIEQMYIDQTL